MWYNSSQYKHKYQKWDETPGHTVEFEYNEICGIIEILDFAKKTGKVLVSYDGESSWIKASHFKNGHLGSCIGKITKDFKIAIGHHFTDHGTYIWGYVYGS